ncbi:hypothetical protein ACET7N_00130 [Aeromonas veronii]
MIKNIMSFMGAWSIVETSHNDELASLRRAIEHYAMGNVSFIDGIGRNSQRLIWEKALYDEGWNVTDQEFFTAGGRKLPVRFIGPQKSGLSAQLAFSNPDFLSKWLFTYATLGVRYGITNIPIMVAPMSDSVPKNDRNHHVSRLGTFEYFQEQLEMLSPISLGFPFLIIGYSIQSSLLKTNIIELQQEERFGNGETNVVINRSIEFPPEYHQAGVGILNFFSTYLNENYPSQNATVRIEQKGLKVKMIVESEDGSSEVIEKALHEYEQIMSGKESATKFTHNEKLILELRNEVRVAKFRIESQQDILALQNEKLRTSESRIDTLLALVGEGLKRDSQPITVCIDSCIQNNMSVTFNSDISSSMGCLEELSELLPKYDDVCLQIFDLSKSLQKIESEKDSEAIRTSSAMTKFSRFIDKLSDTNSSIRKAIDATQEGFEIAQELVIKYNKIASWCGLPSIPTFR